ncbi:MAG: hypothetical protein JXA30_17000 [Deltaproteobacteria bacterium]|nr:hypothetical protein [Deltaproteobacteria bacterium]
MKKGFSGVLWLWLALFFVIALPSRSEASLLKVWAEGRGDVFSGSSDLFAELDSPFGGGLEVGVEILEVSLFGELIAMAGDWWLYTLNLGADMDFGGEEDSVRFTLGFYTGLMYFEFPDLPPVIDFGVLTPEEQNELVNRTGVCANWSDPTTPCPGIELIHSELSALSSQEARFSGAALGWNIIRLRLGLDYPVASFFYLGIAAQVGYHLIITGEQVTAEAKNQLVDRYASKYSLTPETTEKLRQVVSAEPLDTDELGGFNYGMHIYARLEFGLP